MRFLSTFAMGFMMLLGLAGCGKEEDPNADVDQEALKKEIEQLNEQRQKEWGPQTPPSRQR
ncbi:MAG: hypothetical protein KatS3mg105_0570 [Gemmatales bacterium]|nr:MAG: hypothetical protein KatS3mg105_0570 [Gemmatales bacterium]